MYLDFLPLLRKHAIQCFTVVLMGLSSVCFAQTPGDKARTDLVVSNSKGAELQLEVRQIPLAQVLNAIAEKIHVPIHYSVLPEGLVTATCVGTTLKKILECLLDRKADLIVRYPRADAKGGSKWQVAEAWILGSRLDGTVAKDCPATGNMVDKGSLALWQNEQEADAAANQIGALLKITQSRNAAERADAIGALIAAGHEGDPAIKAALEEALHDKDANVRAQAISSLSHREDGNAVAGAIEEALHDDSVDVRMMAVDGITDDVGLLQQAVNDSDETVRGLATLKLEELMQRQKSK